MEDERRAYFRINDIAWVLTAAYTEQQPSVPEYFPQLRQFTAEHMLETVNQELKELEDKLDDKPEIRYVKLLNRKIDLFRQNLLIQHLERLDEHPQTVTISEGGVSFRSHQAYRVGDRIAMALVFSPSYIAIYPKAEVVNCDQGPGEYQLHATFVDMTETMRQHLARHLLAQQMQNRLPR
ncbi:MAG: PilZ domain-containing protein [Natronospirillum sp.]